MLIYFKIIAIQVYTAEFVVQFRYAIGWIFLRTMVIFRRMNMHITCEFNAVLYDCMR